MRFFSAKNIFFILFIFFLYFFPVKPYRLFANDIVFIKNSNSYFYCKSIKKKDNLLLIRDSENPFPLSIKADSVDFIIHSNPYKKRLILKKGITIVAYYSHEDRNYIFLINKIIKTDLLKNKESINLYRFVDRKKKISGDSFWEKRKAGFKKIAIAKKDILYNYRREQEGFSFQGGIYYHLDKLSLVLQNSFSWAFFWQPREELFFIKFPGLQFHNFPVFGRLTLQYQKFPEKINPQNSLSNLDLMPCLAPVFINYSDIRFYFIAGLGLSYFYANRNGKLISDITPVIQFGTGAELFILDNYALYGQIMYHTIFQNLDLGFKKGLIFQVGFIFYL